MAFQKFALAELDDHSPLSTINCTKDSTFSAVPTPNITCPDGGLVAWLQVLGAWVLFFNTWGSMNTFGVFQTYYESDELFTQSSSNIAWIGSIQSFCLQASGIFAGPIYDRGHFKALILVGSGGLVSGYMMLSLVSHSDTSISSIERQRPNSFTHSVRNTGKLFYHKAFSLALVKGVSSRPWFLSFQPISTRGWDWLWALHLQVHRLVVLSIPLL